MECPKCHGIIDDNATVCPYCHKVFLLECPNCSSLCESAVCQNCGYTILVKCSKCSKLNNIKNENCTKCNFPLNTSLAYQECETDEFASVSVKIGALDKIRKRLKTQELFAKFNTRIKNLLSVQIKNVEAKLIIFDNVFSINFNKELSFQTSANKAIRFSLKVFNAFAELNSNIIKELGIPLNLTLTVIKKSSEDLQKYIEYNSNVKLLNMTKKNLPYLTGMQLITDESVFDSIHQEYKTDSLYNVEKDGKNITFYEVILDNYVLPPQKNEDEISDKNVTIMQLPHSEDNEIEQDVYSFNVFDIKAKCTFEKIPTVKLYDAFSNINFNEKKLISLFCKQEYAPDTKELSNYFKKNDYNVLHVVCSETLSYKPWGFFTELVKNRFTMSYQPTIEELSQLKQAEYDSFKPLFDLMLSNPVKAMTPEDARFAYMENIAHFLSGLKNTVIIVENFEKLDDTSIQTLDLYFDKYKNIVPNFVFINYGKTSTHAKIKKLLRTKCYSEYTLTKSSTDDILSFIKSDASNFINSFYYEKIKENYKGSYLYFKQAVEYLKESGIIVEFNDKLIVKNNKSMVIPHNLKTLLKARIKYRNKNADVSLILAFAKFLGNRIDFKTLEKLGIKNIEQSAKLLADCNLAEYTDNIIYITNYSQLKHALDAAMNDDANVFLAKKIITNIGQNIDDAALCLIMHTLKAFKEEYLTLWKNSQFAINTGDYDAYLKNCIGFLSIVDNIEFKLSKEDLEESKKEVYNNILLCLYNYSPSKIYFIENVLLMDAVKENDDEKIVKLSNLMLQGALILTNYTDALGLLHNILSRIKQATLIVNGEINTKIFLLSLVHIEILYNIGNYEQCSGVADELLAVLSPDVIDKVRPVNFSAGSFLMHLMETFRLAVLSKIHMQALDVESFMNKIQEILGIEYPECRTILAIKDFLAGKAYEVNEIEKSSPFSKIVLLIIQELSSLKDDYKNFAQNIYQAKLLAEEIKQIELELICDLLIAYAYFKMGISEKADAIYNDVRQTAEHSALFSIILLSNYFIANKALTNDCDMAMQITNNMLDLMQKNNYQSKILYVLFESLYINILKQQNSANDIETEEKKLLPYKNDLALILK